MIDRFAHGLIGVLAAFARIVLDVLDTAESVLRGLMSNAGLTSDLQTLLLLLMLSVFLFGALRLLKGKLRTIVSFTIVLTMAHTLEHIARG
jgi:hypothetical protein